jgi:hypothetical protein
MKDTPAPIAYPQKAEPCTAHTVLLQMATQSKSSGHAPALAQQITNGIRAFFLEIFFACSVTFFSLSYRLVYHARPAMKSVIHALLLLNSLCTCVDFSPPASVISNKISTGELELFFR